MTQFDLESTRTRYTAPTFNLFALDWHYGMRQFVLKKGQGKCLKASPTSILPITQNLPPIAERKKKINKNSWLELETCESSKTVVSKLICIGTHLLIIQDFSTGIHIFNHKWLFIFFSRSSLLGCDGDWAAVLFPAPPPLPSTRLFNPWCTEFNLLFQFHDPPKIWSSTGGSAALKQFTFLCPFVHF